jgi:hypothetical protein
MMKLSAIIITTTTIGLFLMVNCLHIPALESKEDIFQYLEEDEVKLTDRQNELLGIFRAREHAKEVHLVRIADAPALRDRESILFNLPDGRMLSAQYKEVIPRSEHLFTWIGKTDDPAATILLVVTEKGVTGMMQSPEYHFMIEPLGGDLQALVDVDPSKFPEEHPPITID